MLNLVVDVEAYPEFLKWCEKGEVFEHSEQRQVAGLSVSIKGFKLGFTTENTVKPFVRDAFSGTSLHMRLIDGPFHDLSGQWNFVALTESACKVELSLDYHFRSSLISRLVSSGFKTVAQQLVHDFVLRAHEVYANH